jgi:ATP-dependent RNA helicase DeaD
VIEIMEGFRALGLSEETLAALEKKGFEKPSQIQELTIPLLMNGEKDVVAQAQTGSGKTAAFGLPIIERFDKNTKGIQAIVLTPTRELAIQVAEEIKSFKGNRRIWITTVYGGAPISGQMRDLEKGTDIVVGTPGRVIDLIERGKLILSDVRFVVLDEADEMLNMGFIDDVEMILSKCNKERRMLLFSATMPDRIVKLAKSYMGDYDLVSVKQKELTTDTIEQLYYEFPERDRFEALCRILDVEEDFYGIIFCNTKAEVIEISNHLNDKGYSSDALHGDIAQNLRERVIRQFKTNKYGVLVATDVAARGIDIQDLTHVINYGLPQDPESYVHRIGRTGRAGKSGKAICLIDPHEKRKLLFIQKITRAIMKKGKLPDGQEMVNLKKQRIFDELETVISTEHFGEYLEFAKLLQGENDATTTIAALLKMFLKDELDPKSYKLIRESNREERPAAFGREDRRDGGRDRDRGGRDRDGGRGRDRDNDGGYGRGRNADGNMRLFIAKGRQDKYSPKMLLDLICGQTDVPSRKIDDIKIFDQFSFFSINAEDGETILEIFRRQAKKENIKPLVERARERN